jgi:hypothetical protein
MWEPYAKLSRATEVDFIFKAGTSVDSFEEFSVLAFERDLPLGILYSAVHILPHDPLQYRTARLFKIGIIFVHQPKA